MEFCLGFQDGLLVNVSTIQVVLWTTKSALPKHCHRTGFVDPQIAGCWSSSWRLLRRALSDVQRQLLEIQRSMSRYKRDVKRFKHFFSIPQVWISGVIKHHQTCQWQILEDFPSNLPPSCWHFKQPQTPKKLKKQFGLMGLIWLTVSWIWFVSTWVIPKLMCFVIIIANKIVQIFLEPKAPHEWELKSNCYAWHVTVMKWKLKWSHSWMQSAVNLCTPPQHVFLMQCCSTAPQDCSKPFEFSLLGLLCGDTWWHNCQ